MWTEFKQTLLRRLRGQVIGWGIGLAVYSLLLVALYPSVSQMEDLDQFLTNYPEEMLAFFGNLTLLHTPMGYLDTYFFNYMTIMMGILAVGAGAALLVADEERGTLDLILAHPIGRTALFGGRLLAFTVAIALIVLLNWLCWFVPSRQIGMDLTWVEFLRPFVGLFVQLLLFGALALLLSLALPARRAAAMLAGALLVANYLLQGMANIDERLQAVVAFTPLHYYQGGRAVEGLNWGWLGGLLLVTLGLLLAAWALFQRREIRVGGEHGWRVPGFDRLVK
ncbi:MAG: ABC transporter permease subunit [Chloroflexota bacterium]